MKLFQSGKSKDSEEPAAVEEALAEIVVIDDTPENLHLLNEVLGNEGYKIRALPNGKMGLASCQASPPDLILLDITMPEMDGFEVAQHLKGDQKTKDIPIIFISAMTSIEDKVKAFKSGGVDYVTKPIQVEEVIARVETHLTISRMRNQLNDANEKLLMWNMEVQKKAGAAQAASDPASSIPIQISSLFGGNGIVSGAETEQSLTVFAVRSPEKETAKRVTRSLEMDHNSALLVIVGGIHISVVNQPEEVIRAWAATDFGAVSFNAGVSFGVGVLRYSEDSGLDFDSAAVMKAISELE